MSRVDELERRIEQLEHGQGRLERGVSNGENTYTFFDLRNMGLTRRQAISAMVAIAGGAALPTALSRAVQAQPTGDEGQVGTQANPVEVWASEIDATEIATDQANTADLANAAQDDRLAVGASPPDLTLIGAYTWEEESGSVYTATGSNSATSINPSSLDGFDSYLIYVEAVDQSGNGDNIEMQVGGDTGTNYNEVLLSGTENTGQSEWGPVAAMAPNSKSTFWLMLRDIHGNIGLTTSAARGSSFVQTGFNSNVSWAPSAFTLKRGQDTDWRVRVWGRNV